jgi:hypothetical protein
MNVVKLKINEIFKIQLTSIFTNVSNFKYTYCVELNFVNKIK